MLPRGRAALAVGGGAFFRVGRGGWKGFPTRVRGLGQGRPGRGVEPPLAGAVGRAGKKTGRRATWHPGCVRDGMSTGLYDAVAAMSSAEQRLDMISQNIANASARGFKRQVGTIHSFETAVQGKMTRGQSLQKVWDFAQGELVQTGVSTDLALMGEGFFAFEQGEDVVYSRDGALRITNEGQLVTKEGYPIVWADKTGELDGTRPHIRVDHAGNVFQDEARIGALQLVDFTERARLNLGQDGYYHAPAGLAEEVPTAEVHSGFYEAANTQPVHEMIEMILAQRAYESASNTVSQLADSYRRLTQAR